MVQVEAAWLVSRTLCSWSNHVSVSVSMFCRSNYDVILIVQIILWLPVIIYRTHILWSWDCTVGFWGEAIFQELRMFINIQEVSHWYVPGVTCMLPVEAFATGVRIFKQQEVCLIVHSKGLERLILYRSKVELEPHDLDHLIFVVWRWPWFLDRLSKRALIAWFNFDPDHKRFYSGHISDYPLSFVTRIKMVSTSILSKDQNNQQTTKKTTVWWYQEHMAATLTFELL